MKGNGGRTLPPNPMKYTVNQNVFEAGKIYRTGEEIELTDERAIQLAHVLVRTYEAPANKMIQKKTVKTKG